MNIRKHFHRFVKALIKEGEFYNNGTVVPRDCERAVRAWKQAAESTLYPEMNGAGVFLKQGQTDAALISYSVLASEGHEARYCYGLIKAIC